MDTQSFQLGNVGDTFEILDYRIFRSPETFFIDRKEYFPDSFQPKKRCLI